MPQENTYSAVLTQLSQIPPLILHCFLKRDIIFSHQYIDVNLLIRSLLIRQQKFTSKESFSTRKYFNIETLYQLNPILHHRSSHLQELRRNNDIILNHSAPDIQKVVVPLVRLLNYNPGIGGLMRRIGWKVKQETIRILY